MHEENDIPNLSDWALGETIPQLFPQFPQPTINYLLREREKIGLSDAVRVIGRSRYIHIRRFAEWVENDCRRVRPHTRKKPQSVLQSEGKPSKHKGSKRTGHTASTKRGTIAKN